MVRPRVAIITGGASGIGFAFAEALGKVGFQVAIADMEGAAGAADSLENCGVEALGVSTDVS